MTSHNAERAEELKRLTYGWENWKKNYEILEVKYYQQLSGSTDPLKLPEPCARIILSYLSGKKILEITEVSKYWKEFIECRKSLMIRVMEEVVVKPSKESRSPSLINSLINNSNKREYKHMDSPFYRFNSRSFTILKCINPIEVYASTLNTLTIRGHDFDGFKQPFTFPVLRRLTIKFDHKLLLSLKSLYSKCSFPELTHLRIDDTSEDIFCEILDRILPKYPKLETISIDNSFMDEFPTISSDYDDFVAGPLTQPKLKNIYIVNFDETFFQHYKNSLVKLELNFIDFWHFKSLLQNLTVLKYFSVKMIYDLIRHRPTIEENFMQNKSIEVFKVYNALTEDEEGEEMEATDQIPRILLALPSLRDVVILKDLTKEVMLLLASNMRYLKKLTCKEITPQLKLAYEEIQNNPDQYINSSFEFIADPNHELYQIQDEFI